MTPLKRDPASEIGQSSHGFRLLTLTPSELEPELSRYVVSLTGYLDFRFRLQIAEYIDFTIT
jgi:hypothetical protein